MTVGQKIKYIRNHRKMTQKELGVAVGFSSSTSETRLYQYESDMKTPKENLLLKFAEALNVSAFALLPKSNNKVIDLVEHIMWLETDISNMVDEEREYGQIYTNSQMLRVHLTVIDCAHRVGVVSPKLDLNNLVFDDLLAYSLDEYSDLQRYYFNRLVQIDKYIEWKLQWPNVPPVYDFMCKHYPDDFKKIKDNLYDIRSTTGMNYFDSIITKEIPYLFDYFKADMEKYEFKLKEIKASE